MTIWAPRPRIRNSCPRMRGQYGYKDQCFISPSTEDSIDVSGQKLLNSTRVEPTAGDLQLERAADRLGLILQRIERLLIRYRHDGPIGLVSRHRNLPGIRTRSHRLSNGWSHASTGTSKVIKSSRNPRVLQAP